MDLSGMYQRHHQEKHRLGFSILEKERAEWFLAHAPKGGAWLDVGCRDATLSSHFSEVADTFKGMDIDPSALEAAQKRMPHASFQQVDVLGDWHELKGQQFDVIICSEVLEHLYFPERVTAMIAKHLKPGGMFLGSVPNAFFVKHRLRYLLGRRNGTPIEDPTHITQFNCARLREILLPVGSEIVLEGYTRPPFVALAKRFPGFFGFNFLFTVRRAAA